MVVDCHDPLPVVRVDQIPREENAQRWLVDGLWGDSSVGVVGGAPKCSKTWLGLDLALSVASGTPCLGRQAVPRPGPVLIYLAEDALAVVRERVEGMARHRGLELVGVDLHVITAPSLRLDREPHRNRLLETAKRLPPRLLLLDPLVRLHGVDGDRQGNLQEGVLACLVPGQTLTRAKLRDVLSVQNQRLGEVLETLERAGKIRRTPAGGQRVD